MDGPGQRPRPRHRPWAGRALALAWTDIGLDYRLGDGLLYVCGINKLTKMITPYRPQVLFAVFDDLRPQLDCYNNRSYMHTWLSESV